MTRISRIHVMALITKELRQIMSDKSVLIVAFVIPLLLVILYGSGLRMDIKPVSVALVSSKLDDPITREVAFAFSGSEYFNFYMVNNEQDAKELMRQHEISAYVIQSNNLSQNLYHQPSQVMVVLNGVDAQQANIARSYIEAVAMTALMQKGFTRQVSYVYTRNSISEFRKVQNQRSGTAEAVMSSGNNVMGNSAALTGFAGQNSSVIKETFTPQYQPVTLNVRNWFNESNESTWYLMAGQLIGVVTLMSSFMCSIVIAREFERGTMTGILATHATSSEVLIAKIVPYYVLACLGGACAILVAMLLYELPFRGNVLLYIATMAIYLYVCVMMGLLISILTQNQFLSSEYAIILSFLPSILLSGAIFDLRSIPELISWIAHLFPPTYAVESSKICMLSGGSTDILLRNIGILCIFSLLFTVMCDRLLFHQFVRYLPANLQYPGNKQGNGHVVVQSTSTIRSEPASVPVPGEAPNKGVTTGFKTGKGEQS